MLLTLFTAFFLKRSSKQIIHRDLKSKNIFCDSFEKKDVKIKIGDFGLATMKGLTEEAVVEETTKLKTMNTSRIGSLDLGSTITGGLKGSIYWIAPETLRSSQDYSVQSDVYAFGIVLYEMVCGILPYGPLCQEAITFQVGSGRMRPDLSLVRPDTLPMLVRLMRETIAFHPINRPTFKQIFVTLVAQPNIFRYESRPTYNIYTTDKTFRNHKSKTSQDSRADTE